jgi:drug/metabolite transporter (DMT)-like permease
MPPNPSFKAIALLILLALIWGTSFILIKQGLKVFEPQELATLRVSAAFLFLLPVALIRLKQLGKRDYQIAFVSGMLGIFFPAFLFSTAQTQIASSVAGILNTLSPIWVMIVGAAFFSQRFTVLSIIGTIVGMGGTILLMMARSGGNISDINYYALLIVAACALYGANVNWVKFKGHHISPLTLTSVSVMLIGPISIVYLFGVTDFTWKMQNAPGAWTAFGFVVLLGCMSTALATYLFTVLLKISTPLFASSVTYLMPLVSVGWGLLAGESLYTGHYIGMVAIIGGVWLANRK